MYSTTMFLMHLRTLQYQPFFNTLYIKVHGFKIQILSRTMDIGYKAVHTISGNTYCRYSRVTNIIPEMLVLPKLINISANSEPATLLYIGELSYLYFLQFDIMTKLNGEYPSFSGNPPFIEYLI